MEIKRDNFRFNRVVEISDIIDKSHLLLMEQTDIDDDNNVHDCTLADGDTMIVLQNGIEPYQDERYCYVKYHTIVGGDGNTKLMVVEKIIIDENLINHDLFAHVFTILLRQEDSEYTNRIMVTNGYNERFHGKVDEVANDIANRICGLYNTFTDDYHTSYVIQ